MAPFWIYELSEETGMIEEEKLIANRKRGGRLKKIDAIDALGLVFIGFELPVQFHEYHCMIG